MFLGYMRPKGGKGKRSRDSNTGNNEHLLNGLEVS